MGMYILKCIACNKHLMNAGYHKDIKEETDVSIIKTLSAF